MIPHRKQLFAESELPDGRSILDRGKALATDWQVGPSAFHDYFKVNCEAEYKLQCVQQGKIMQHAHMGFRDKAKSKYAFAHIYEQAEKQGVRVDRFGLCLDWSMGFPRNVRSQQMRGTGLILDGPEDFAEVANAAPAATHFGDFVLGFPAALENTQCALSAGATVIGNLGQYFTFRLPDWNDDIATTTSTLTAIGLMSAQPVKVMVHSNLDDGFAAVFEDLSCALGAAMLERYIIEDLAGGCVTHCFGHHYSTPVLRMAFQRALARVNPNPGSMIYGNTVLYRGTDAENYASLASYLMLDLLGQTTNPSGHALNPVPVTENRRIPEIQEIIDAQLFAGQLSQSRAGYAPIYDDSEVDRISTLIMQNGQQFYQSTLTGLEQSGYNIKDPFEMLLAIRRIGGKALERAYGPGQWNPLQDSRAAIVTSDTVREIAHLVQYHIQQVSEEDRNSFINAGLKVVVATTDVHEHGKSLLEGLFKGLSITIVDGGVSADPRHLAAMVEKQDADAIALSTYNGVALTYFCQLRDELTEAGLTIPVMIGGQLNEIPEDSDNSLPVDVETKLKQQGAIVCHGVLDAVPVLRNLLPDKHGKSNRSIIHSYN